MPPYSDDVQLEAELAIVIARVCQDVSAEDAEDYIYGFTCANDVTARDLQRQEDQWFRAKAFDTSLPLGPWIETELAHDDVAITARINGETRQNGNSKDMILDVPNAIAMISEVITLLPGDVILTGTPERRHAHAPRRHRRGRDRRHRRAAQPRRPARLVRTRH